MSDSRVSVTYFSDVLCVWAYVAEIRVDELRRNFPENIELEYRFVSIFGDTNAKIGEGWSDRGGFAGYADHVRHVLEGFDHVDVRPEVWTRDIPAGSYGTHAFCKAAAVLETERLIEGDRREQFGGRTTVEELIWRLRLAFFRDLRDVGRLDVQLDVADGMGLPTKELRQRVEDGRALAALAADHEAARRMQVTGSPTFLLNEGRQRLYGNVGYRIVEANIQEMLRDNRDRASWC